MKKEFKKRKDVKNKMMIKDLFENGCIAPWTHIIVRDWVTKDVICGGIDKSFLINKVGSDEIMRISVNDNQLHIYVEHRK